MLLCITGGLEDVVPFSTLAHPQMCDSDPVRWSRNYFYLHLKNNWRDDRSFSQWHFARDHIISSYFHSRHKVSPLRESVETLTCVQWTRPLCWVSCVSSFLCPPWAAYWVMPLCLVCWNPTISLQLSVLILYNHHFHSFCKSPQALALPTDDPNSCIPDKIKCVLKSTSKFWCLSAPKFLCL